MQVTGKMIYSKYLVALILAVPNILIGIALSWQQGIALLSVLNMLFILLINLMGAYFFWIWHVDQIELLKNQHQQMSKEAFNNLLAYTSEIENLQLLVSPILFKQIVDARVLTEQEISILIRRFTAMLEELEQITNFVNQTTNPDNTQNLENLGKNAEKIRVEIDIVLEALQFQDRVSQILSQVENNLTTLSKTIETIQSQGNKRNQGMIQVQELVSNIQRDYESVNHFVERSESDTAASELTYF